MEKYKKALSEVDTIINNMPDELSKKIPCKFKEVVHQEKDKEYNPDVNQLVIENNMLPETVAILGLIYSDYLCSKEEREKLLLKEKKNIQTREQEETSDYNDLFKKHIEKEQVQLVVIKEKWYQKVVDYFKKNNWD